MTAATDTTLPEAVALDAKGLSDKLWRIREFIEEERLPDPENAHPNDRGRFEDRCKEHPAILAEIDALRSALSHPAALSGGDSGAVTDMKIGEQFRARCKELYQKLGRDGMLRQGDPVETITEFAWSIWQEGYSEGYHCDAYKQGYSDALATAPEGSGGAK